VRPAVRRAVFLDRDGTINRARVERGRPYPPRSVDEFVFLPGAIEAIDRLHGAGFMTIVVTNQPDVAIGKQRRDVVDQFHRLLLSRCKLDDIRVCFETDLSGSRCYKPRPGMLEDAAAEHGIDLASSYVVGDRWRDVGAARNAGCYAILIDCGYAEPERYVPHHRVASLAEAADHILAREDSVEED